MPLTPSPIQIGFKFKAYDKTIRDIWEAFQFMKFYLPLVQEEIRASRMADFQMEDLGGSLRRSKSKKDTYGVISHVLAHVSPHRSLIAAVSQTEAFLQYLATRVLKDYPRK